MLLLSHRARRSHGNPDPRALNGYEPEKAHHAYDDRDQVRGLVAEDAAPAGRGPAPARV